jgi:hypothetical protein
MTDGESTLLEDYLIRQCHKQYNPGHILVTAAISNVATNINHTEYNKNRLLMYQNVLHKYHRTPTWGTAFNLQSILIITVYSTDELTGEICLLKLKLRSERSGWKLAVHYPETRQCSSLTHNSNADDMRRSLIYLRNLTSAVEQSTHQIQRYHNFLAAQNESELWKKTTKFITCSSTIFICTEYCCMVYV